MMMTATTTRAWLAGKVTMSAWLGYDECMASEGYDECMAPEGYDECMAPEG